MKSRQRKSAITACAAVALLTTTMIVPPTGSAQSVAGKTPGSESGVVAAQLPKDPPPVAPDYRATQRPLPPADRVGVDAANQLPITIEEAIVLALANNKDITASRIDVELTRFDLAAAKGAYDPRLSTESYFEKRTTPVASIIGGGAEGRVNQTDLVSSARVAGASPVGGGSYQVDFSASRQTTDNLFASLSPLFPSALTFTYVQPLWKGLKTDDNRRRIEIAKKSLSLTDSQFRQRAIEVITRVEQAYWDLVFALRNLQVQLDAVKQARTQLGSIRRRVEQGMLAPIDVVSADTQVSLFEQNVYTAQEGVTRAENALKTLILPERTAPLWSQALLPISPVSLEPPRAPLEEAVTAALANRPEIEQVATSQEVNKVNQRFFADQTKPQIDVIGAFSTVGLAGKQADRGPNPFTASNAALLARVNQLSKIAGLPELPSTSSFGTLPDMFLGGPGQSLANLVGFNFPTARVGVRFTFPVGNRTAEASLGRALAEGRRIQNQREQIEQLIEADVRSTMQSIRSGEARLKAASAARAWSELQYESERRRFDAGMSTVFLVLQRQTDLIGARGRELQAQTDLNKAIAEYQRATGSTLQANKVTVRTDKSHPVRDQ